MQIVKKCMEGTKINIEKIENVVLNKEVLFLDIVWATFCACFPYGGHVVISTTTDGSVFIPTFDPK